jgi:hypothetical protein
MDLHGFPLFMFLSVGAIALFSFIAVASWAEARRKEREAYYRSEAIKKIAETQGAGGPAAIEYLREEDRLKRRRVLEAQKQGQKLGGLTTVACGIGLMAFLWAVGDKDSKGVFLVGAIPFLIGVALLVYAYVMAPKE